MQTSMFLLPCISFLFTGSATRLRWSMETLHLLLLWLTPILLVNMTMSSVLSGVDLSDYDLISCTKDGFVSAVLKPMDNHLNHLM